MRRIIVGSLCILIGSGSFVPAAFAQAPGVSMAPEISCIPANQNPKASVALSPMDGNASCRLYFKSALGTDWYYINLARGASGFEGTLPAPVAGAGPISYYAECIVSTTPGQSAQIDAVVVDSASECKDKPVAAAGPSSPVTVYSVAGGAAIPAGFTGIGSVLAGTSITAGAGAAAVAAGGAAAAGGGLLSTTTLIVAAGVVGVGTTVAVVADKKDKDKDKEPKSPSK